MFDIGAMELMVVAVLALVVVGPKELPGLLRTITGFVRRVREMAADFRAGVDDLASEIEREVDPFKDLRKQEGLRPGMNPREITEHIMNNRAREAAQNSGPADPEKTPTSLGGVEAETHSNAHTADTSAAERNLDAELESVPAAEPVPSDQEQTSSEQAEASDNAAKPGQKPAAPQTAPLKSKGASQ